jgi:hypothetical protein
MRQHLLSVGGLIVAAVVGLQAQWFNYPDPRIPRLPDGKPNLSAPPPRAPDGKPDFSGVWASDPGGYQLNITAELEPEHFQPWALAVSKERANSFAAGSPTARCLPAGPTIRSFIGPSEIVQTSRMMVLLNETTGRFRQVFLDGRTLPMDPNPTWDGYSVGSWDGDTLIVESAGYNDRSWLDFAGHPHSDALRLTERYRRTDFGHIELQITIDDPKAYRKPWTIEVGLRLIPDADLLENVCAENQQPTSKMLSAGNVIARLSRDQLGTLIGVYEERPGRNWQVTLKGDELPLQRPGQRVPAPMIPLSATDFALATGASIQFSLDNAGAVSGFVFANVESETRTQRKSP